MTIQPVGMVDRYEKITAKTISFYFRALLTLPVYGKCSIYALRSGEHDLQENDVRIKSVNRMIF